MLGGHIGTQAMSLCPQRVRSYFIVLYYIVGTVRRQRGSETSTGVLVLQDSLASRQRARYLGLPPSLHRPSKAGTRSFKARL